MREPRFRAWIERYQKYMPVAMIHFEPILGKIDYIEVVATGGDWAKFYPEEFIIEQYTGLKDKNGKEIYEGDIVRNTVEVAPNKSSTYKIYYDQHHAMYAMSPVDGKIDIGDFYGYIMRRHFEVIGNVHENGDLLKEEE